MFLCVCVFVFAFAFALQGRLGWLVVWLVVWLERRQLPFLLFLASGLGMMLLYVILSRIHRRYILWYCRLRNNFRHQPIRDTTLLKEQKRRGKRLAGRGAAVLPRAVAHGAVVMRRTERC